MAYVQSDEITLCFYNKDPKSQIWFNNRHSKIVSQSAALATLFFNKACEKHLKEFLYLNPSFDSRCFQVPTLEEAVNVFLWREKDCTKNSITVAAQTFYSHKQLQGKNSSQKQEMLFQKGINWNDYPSFFKKGTYIQKVVKKSKFTFEEIDKLPLKHAARSNPNLEVERSCFEILDLPPLATILNKKEVILEGKKFLV